MRAVVLSEFGPPENLVLTERPDLEPGAGEVLIEVDAASITFIETQMRAGTGFRRPELPTVLGNGVAGRVVAVGPGVDAGWAGRSVVTTTGGAGGYASQAIAAVDDLLSIPDGLDPLDALALLADGRTAMRFARAARPAAGEWVLVLAAGGGVGSLLVQLSANAGARVVAAASSAAKLALAKDLGADATVDYTGPGWADRVREVTGGGVDVAYDGVGGAIGAATVGLVRDGGRLCVFGLASGSMTSVGEADRARLTLIGLAGDSAEELRALSRAALEEAAAGRLRPTIGQTFPLERAAQAHAAIEARAALGKTLLIVR